MGFFVQMPIKTLKKALKSRILYGPVRNFQYCKPAQNQTKSHILLHKKGLARYLYIVTLVTVGNGSYNRMEVIFFYLDV